jgi:iron complex outermembrane receptor protein
MAGCAWLVEAADRNATNRAADPRPAGPRQGTGDPALRRSGQPSAQLFVNSQYSINDNIDWYAFASYGERETSSAATFRTAYTDDNRTHRCAPALYPEGFLPLRDSTSSTPRW